MREFIGTILGFALLLLVMGFVFDPIAMAHKTGAFFHAFTVPA